MGTQSWMLLFCSTRKPNEDEISAMREATPQILAVAVKSVLLLGFGMTLGYPTILIPAFSDSNIENSFLLGKALQKLIYWSINSRHLSYLFVNGRLKNKFVINIIQPNY